MRRLILILFAVPTVALAADANNGRPSQNAVPAASQPAKAAAKPAPPAAPPPVSIPPMPPAVIADSTDCRMSCAQANYFCRASNDDSDCSPVWSQCVAACVTPNVSTAVSTAP